MEARKMNASDIVLLVTFIITVLAPCLYLIGYLYAKYYFEAFGCAWIVDHFSSQEIIKYALDIALIMFIGFVISMWLESHGRKSLTILGLFLFSMIAVPVSMYIYYKWISPSSTNLPIKTGTLMGIAVVGYYIADILRSYKIGTASTIEISVTGGIVGAASLIGLSLSLGEINGKQDVKKIKTLLPELVLEQEANNASNQAFLLTTTAGRFLVIETAKDGNRFKLIDSLEGYIIRPPGSPNVTHAPQSPHPTES